MQVLLIGGFDDGGKMAIMKNAIDRAFTLDEGRPLTIILNDVGEKELSDVIGSPDIVQIEELRGGCLCCSMGGDLRRIMQKRSVADSEMVLIEASGTCSLPQLKASLSELDPVSRVSSSYVVDVESLRHLMDLIPVFNDNVITSDSVVLTGCCDLRKEELDRHIGLLSSIDDELSSFDNQASCPDRVIITRRGRGEQHRFQ